MSTDSFYDALSSEINAQIASVYGVTVTLLQTPGMGGFLWDYVSPDGIFNAGTFAFLSASVEPAGNGVAQLSSAGGFPNAYVQVVSPLIYRLSSGDQQTIDAQVKAAGALAQVIVGTYQGIFGAITPADMLQAQLECGLFAVQTQQDYVVSYVLGAQWSGRQATGQPPLTYSQMAAAGSEAALTALLPAMPEEGAPVVTAVWAYIEAVAPVAALQSQVQLANWTIAQLNANAGQPSAANGGMKTVDPATGTVSDGYQVGYSVTPSVAAIENALDDISNLVAVAFNTAPPSGQTALLSAAGGSQYPLLEAEVASFSMPGAATCDLLQAGGPASSVEISIVFPGCTLVKVAAAPFDASDATGWFLAPPIAEAVANGSSDVTGYAFAVPPAVNLQSFQGGGTFGTLTALLISDTPAVTFRYENCSTNIVGAAPAGVGGTLTLFGLFTLQGSLGTVLTEGGTQTRSFNAQAPAALSAAAVPQMLRSAFPIGCTFLNPAQ